MFKSFHGAISPSLMILFTTPTKVKKMTLFRPNVFGEMLKASVVVLTMIITMVGRGDNSNLERCLRNAKNYDNDENNGWR